VNTIPVTRAEGVYFYDADGKRYLDFASQLVNTNVGHQNPKVVKAIQDQAASLTFVAPGMATEPRGLLGRKLAEITPGDLKKTFFTLGGAEANENAIKIARFFTGRYKIMARYRSYHGATYGSIALTGDYRRLPVDVTGDGGGSLVEALATSSESGAVSVLAWNLTLDQSKAVGSAPHDWSVTVRVAGLAPGNYVVTVKSSSAVAEIDVTLDYDIR
jgi:hypothetical protein